MKVTSLISIALTLVLTFLLGYFSIEFLGAYGWTVFLFVPILIGFLPGYIASRKIKISKNQTYFLGYITLALGCFLMLIFAFEGLICLAMALPLMWLASMLGSFVSYRVTTRRFSDPFSMTFLILLFSASFLSFDSSNKAVKLIEVTTSVKINASIQDVWDNVIALDELPEPTNWIFKAGIAYPTQTEIIGTGVGAIRKSNFSTGSFLAPITIWDEPSLLAFDVTEQPVPMAELNPFWDNITPPHLDGYFKSYKGQFKLSELPNGKTKLEGSTWYRIDIQPEFYWKLWSNFVVHKIHKRVLKHIKEVSESKQTPKTAKHRGITKHIMLL